VSDLMGVGEETGATGTTTTGFVLDNPPTTRFAPVPPLTAPSLLPVIKHLTSSPNLATPIKITSDRVRSYPSIIPPFPPFPTAVQMVSESATLRCVTGMVDKRGAASEDEIPGMTSGGCASGGWADWNARSSSPPRP
jgi:hypothetical protein